MPPKKQEQDLSASYKPSFILPLFAGSPDNAIKALRKPVNIKKNIDKQKIIQLLKDKGIEQNIGEDGNFSIQGRKMIGQNIKSITEEVVASYSKPADPKKDAKKDTKKDSKKEEPVQEAQPPIQLNFQKNCNDFYFYLDFPHNSTQLQMLLDSEARIDIVVFIKDKIKPGSNKPDFTLLNNQKSIQDLEKNLNETISVGNLADDSKERQKNCSQMRKKLQQKKKKVSQDHPLKKAIILEIPFFNNLSNPQQNQQKFINSIFERISKCTIQEEKYQSWKSERKVTYMIEPIKQVVKKEVQVQSNDKGKKGGKGETVTEIVEQVVETPYEDIAEHIKSDLTGYFEVKKSMKIKEKDSLDIDPQVKSVYNDILGCCINSVCVNKNDGNVCQEQKIQSLADKISRKYEIRALNKATIQSLSQNVRKILFPTDMSMIYPFHFEYPPIQTQISFMQLAHHCTTDLETLKVEYIINKMEELAKRESPRINWDFRDRQHIQKFSVDRIRSIINKQIMNSPQIFTGMLETEGIKLIITSQTNPPGRVLHQNSIFEWKVIPDFQNWSDYFLKSEEILSIEQFYNYSCENAGNLSIKIKRMMPTDNSIIKDEKWNIGSKNTRILRVQKNKTNFGMIKNQEYDGNNKYIYWHNFGEECCMKIFKEKKLYEEKSVTKIEPSSQEEGDKNNCQQNIQTNSQILQKSSVCTWMQLKGKYLLKCDEGADIFWYDDNVGQRNRTFSKTGQITCFKKDGSICIYDPKGDTSIYKNGRWTRIVDNNFIVGSNQTIPVKFDEMIEGQTIINVREDQTIFITLPNKDKKTIFPDGTEIYHTPKSNKIEIKNPFDISPIIRINQARQYNYNLIGYGSAFAYLGFTNVLERSYDGYMFEVIDKEISINQYTERFDKNGTILEEKVRLIAHKDSSLIKINTDSGTIVYNSPDPDKVLTQSYLNERWLQAFTPPGNHQQMEAGIFDIDLNIGQIENKDAESNKFVVKVDGKSQVNIAVSFINADGEQDEDSSAVCSSNGFHVKQQNYFLPPPQNRIPARLFAIMPDGSGVEYLNSTQYQHLRNFTISQENKGNKIVRQYTKQQKQDNEYLQVSFAQKINLDKFGLPNPLKSPQTKEQLVPLSFCSVKHCVIETLNWPSDFKNISSLSEKILAARKEKEVKSATLKI